MAPVNDPIRSELTDGILTLVIDTPGCDYNIFSVRAADRLIELVEDIDPAHVRAVVLRSAKRKSFVNGVGLMLANAMREPRDIVRLTKPVRRAYETLGNLSVPTIAAVHGNCFGCGVELTLRCDYRVADDRYDTQFYMTEVADYLFVPCFGGTLRLPRLMGLEAATRFLLWGNRWNAEQACREGLVDEVFSPETFDASLSKFVSEVASGARLPRIRSRGNVPPDDAVPFIERTTAEIAALPPSYQPVYRECFSLLLDASRGHGSIADADERELAASGRTVVTHGSKAAQSFFFVRQMAEGLATRGAPSVESIGVEIVGLPALATELERRRLRDVHLLPAGNDTEPVTLRLRPASSEQDAHIERAEGACDVEVALGRIRPTSTGDAPIALCMPSAQGEIRAAEVAVRDPMFASKASAVADFLLRAGWVPIVSHYERGFALDAMLDAYFKPLVRHLERGGTATEVCATLRELGFVRGPGALLRLFPGHEAAEPLVAVVPGDTTPVADVADALLMSLLAFALEARLQRWLSHPSAVDMLAREVLDFPLGQGSLCRYLTPARTEQLLQRSEAIEPLVGSEAIARARGYAEAGRGFYR